MSKFLIVSKQTLWQVLGKIITAITTFLVLGIIARGYGEAGTGVFTLALTYLGIFYLLADFGFNAHFLAQFQHLKASDQISDWRKLLGTRIVWSLVLLVFAVATLPFWPFSTPAFINSVLLGSLAIVSSAIFVTSNLFFQSKLRYDLSVLSNIIGVLFGLGAVLLFNYLNLPLSFMLLAHMLGWLIVAKLSLLLVRRFSGSILPLFDKNFFINLIKDSWPIAATLALNVIYFRADVFMLSYFKGNAEVGIYNIAYSVFQTALVLPAFIMNAYYPLMIQAGKENAARLNKQLLVAGVGLLALSILGVLITYMLAPLVITLLTGGGFDGSITSLRILALGFPAYFISALLMWLFVIKKYYKLLLAVYFLGLTFNLFANYIYIPQFSYLAAAWVTVLSEYLILFMQFIILAILKLKK